uniref:Uncharacterized protein n=1 Tax=Medicago truncatula TaxID=3880 RepID=A2Q5V1_MEDTR|nr:hypothetical protein MtrDRAFT_AC169177g9v1 [Medicago truncatula]
MAPIHKNKYKKHLTKSINSSDGRNTQLIVPETQPILSSIAAAIKSVEILKENWSDLASDSDEQSLEGSHDLDDLYTPCL